MSGIPRRQAIPADEVGVYHCFNRCVQQAYLCGVDPITEVDYSHRKVWIRDKIRELARSFALDLLKISLMDNHLHLLVRTRPDLAGGWDDREVARRWWELCPERREDDGAPAEPHDMELAHWLNDPERMAELRLRLASPSWLMALWCGDIGRRCNRETGKRGRFFEERFRSVRLLDEAAVLACAMYVDLNPIRAGKAETPEESRFTSVYDRIQGRRQRAARAAEAGAEVPADGSLLLDVCYADDTDADAWLAPITLDADQRLNELLSQWFDDAASIKWSDLEVNDDDDVATDDVADTTPPDTDITTVPKVADATDVVMSAPYPSDNLPGGEESSAASSEKQPCETNASPKKHLASAHANTFPAARASNKGFLTTTLDEYLQLLDWVGRQLRRDKRGVIPADLPPILERLGIRGESFIDLIENFSTWFRVAAGSVGKLLDEARRLGRSYLHGRARCEQAFT